MEARMVREKVGMRKLPFEWKTDVLNEERAQLCSRKDEYKHEEHRVFKT
jgi:hypothetical protein